MGVGGQRHAPTALPGTKYIADWAGPRAGLEGCGKTCHHRDSISGPSSPTPTGVKSITGVMVGRGGGCTDNRKTQIIQTYYFIEPRTKNKTVMYL
jgi:hypothetical protein